ncbi:hypothetical protein DPMN_009107 [Dreissena polymorpha]|uniref:Uncharacterized protein n=1 Tax=Dreissena polymorpha TaxID=45954 RepID=A0A9D4RZU5_DREPO|nr:hypothetical protein DPMN_009107 [Dreissena polymorpha]
MDQLSVPTSESLQELCTSLQTQHSELLRNQLKLVQQAVLKNHNQNKKSQTKMIIINPVGRYWCIIKPHSVKTWLNAFA